MSVILIPMQDNLFPNNRIDNFLNRHLYQNDSYCPKRDFFEFVFCHIINPPVAVVKIVFYTIVLFVKMGKKSYHSDFLGVMNEFQKYSSLILLNVMRGIPLVGPSLVPRPVLNSNSSLPLPAPISAPISAPALRPSQFASLPVHQVASQMQNFPSDYGVYLSNVFHISGVPTAAEGVQINQTLVSLLSSNKDKFYELALKARDIIAGSKAVDFFSNTVISHELWFFIQLATFWEKLKDPSGHTLWSSYKSSLNFSEQQRLKYRLAEIRTLFMNHPGHLKLGNTNWGAQIPNRILYQIVRYYQSGNTFSVQQPSYFSIPSVAGSRSQPLVSASALLSTGHGAGAGSSAGAGYGISAGVTSTGVSLGSSTSLDRMDCREFFNLISRMKRSLSSKSIYSLPDLSVHSWGKLSRSECIIKMLGAIQGVVEKECIAQKINWNDFSRRLLDLLFSHKLKWREFKDLCERAESSRLAAGEKAFRGFAGFWVLPKENPEKIGQKEFRTRHGSTSGALMRDENFAIAREEETYRYLLGAGVYTATTELGARYAGISEQQVQYCPSTAQSKNQILGLRVNADDDSVIACAGNSEAAMQATNFMANLFVVVHKKLQESNRAYSQLCHTLAITNVNIENLAIKYALQHACPELIGIAFGSFQTASCLLLYATNKKEDILGSPKCSLSIVSRGKQVARTYAGDIEISQYFQ